MKHEIMKPWLYLVEMKGFEPSACALRTHRSPI
jgi:hypothetical protein